MSSASGAEAESSSVHADAEAADLTDEAIAAVPEAVEDPAKAIAARLIHHRTRRGMKVSELAREVGVSPSLISQIERGQSRPSVSTLFALAEALDVPVDAFFARSEVEHEESEVDQRSSAPPAAISSRVMTAPHEAAASAVAALHQRGAAPGHRYLVRHNERATIDIEGGVRWERLTPSTLSGVEFLELVYGPRAQSHETLYRHPGTEMVLLLSGRMDIYVGFERHELTPGDSIEFPSSLPHRYVNPTDYEARAVTVILDDSAGLPHPKEGRL